MMLRSAGWFLALGCALLASACVPAAPPTATPARDAVDAPSFAAIIERLRSTTNGELRVDPRPAHARADLAWLNAADLAPQSEAITRERTRALRRLGLRAADALMANRCRGSMPPPDAAVAAVPDSLRAQCTAVSPVTVLLVSVPAPAGEVNGRATWTVTAARITNWSYDIHELRLTRDDAGRVAVIGARERIIDAS